MTQSSSDSADAEPSRLNDVFVRGTAQRFVDRTKFVAHHLKKHLGVKPIAAHNALARAARFDGWTTMLACCKRIADNPDEESPEAFRQRLDLIGGAMPLLIEVDGGRPPDERQATALTDFAERVAVELGKPRAGVLDAFARSQHAASWEEFLARKSDAGGHPLYSLEKFGLRVQVRPSDEEHELALSVTPAFETFSEWPILPPRPGDVGPVIERSKALLAGRPDFLRGYAMLGAALDNLRDPSCLDWYEKARAGLAILVEKQFDRHLGLSAQIPSDIPSNRWLLNVARLEAWALARYHANFGGAVALTMGRIAFDPMDLERVQRDQIAFACANGSWNFLFRAKEHDMASVFISGLFGVLRSVAHGAEQLDPRALAQLLRAWVTDDWATNVLTAPLEQLELLNKPIRIGACIKLIREQRAAEFEVFMEMLTETPKLQQGVDYLINKRQQLQASQASPLPSLNEWGRECRTFIAAITGLPEAEV